ncbi:helix-turn-helix transcriptional regulator [Peteryoungia ipomoeae]|uniref:Helix-turn-helix transcriptional regulator n=1 Tax=Peteryoungia ipomoeae TaxID=1210932 RepID=A0A4S8P5E7_9HYPH|nr:helix-turn-helix transcriptional regulator [Peteryoungia ipomoeae]
MARRSSGDVAPTPPSPASPAVPSHQHLGRYESLVAATCTFLQLDLSAHHNLDELARQVGTNRNTLAKAFRQVLEAGVHEWFRETRLNHAAALLTETDRPIQQIGFDVGFDNAANFSTAFRLHHGHSPREYRELVRNQKLTVTVSKDG